MDGDIRKLIHDLGRPDVKIVGPSRDPGPFYRSADAFVSPSISENMASGTPVITPNMCGLSSVITPGINGFVYNYYDIDGLAAHLETLYRDRQRATEIGMAARRTAEGSSMHSNAAPRA